jgi:hypothetical protein
VSDEDDKDAAERPDGGTGLRVVLPSNEGRPAPDSELKAILDDMKRRYHVTRERLGDDTPDAA